MSQLNRLISEDQFRLAAEEFAKKHQAHIPQQQALFAANELAQLING
jgi:hypothetical protein